MSPRKTPTRAEAVRQRRKREDERRLVTQSLERPTRRRTAAPTPPPAVTRNVSVDAATVRAAPRQTRQYEAMAAAPVRSLQAPAMPRIRIGWRMLSLFLALLLSAGVYFAFSLPELQVGGVTLSGNTFLGANEVNTALGLNGTPIFLVVPEDVKNALRLNFPEISAATVTVGLPNVVNVTITERQPVVRWEQGNSYTWLDADGIAFRPRGDAPGLVVVKASDTPPAGPKSDSDPLAPTPFVAADIVKTARLLAPYAPQGSSLLYDSKYGIGWVDARGWTVWFGSSSDQLDMKLRVYIVLVESLNQRGIAPLMINVAYPDAPYYRLGQ